MKIEALMVIDVQNDFLPGGALPIVCGEAMIESTNQLIAAFTAAGLPIILTRDWHPRDHSSVAQQGGPWPPHCVQGTDGTRLAACLRAPATALLIDNKVSRKGEATSSAFDKTPLASLLAELGVKGIAVCGLATDYCVMETVLDARALGYEIMVAAEAIQGIDVRPGDCERAIQRMRAAGARIEPNSEIFAALRKETHGLTWFEPAWL